MGEHIGTTTTFHFREPLASEVSKPEELYDKVRNNLGSHLISAGSELRGKAIIYKFEAQWHDANYKISIICFPDQLNEINSVDIKYSTENNEEGQELDEEQKLADAQSLLDLMSRKDK